MILQIPEGDFDAYVFDCDGTLADTMPLHYQSWQTVLQPYECDFPEALFYELGGAPTETIVEILNERHGRQLPVEETARRKEEIYTALIPGILPIEPVVAFARQFFGVKPLAVASGGPRNVVRKTLAVLGIVDQFAAIIGAEDYVNPKPAPDPYLAAARSIGVDPRRCLAFEDTRIGIQSASAAGMKTVLVPLP